MAQKGMEPQDEESRLRKKIDDCNKYQWLVFIPLWVVTLLQMIFPARTIPVPEIYILFLDVGALLFSVIAFIAIRLRVKKLRDILAQLEKTENYIPKRFKAPRR